MTELLVKIIPLDLAATLSPGILALTLLLLGSQFHPRLRTFSLFLGTLIVAVGLAFLGLFLGQATPEKMQMTLVSAVFDLLLGAVFIWLGLRALTSKERKIQPKEAQGPQIFKWILIGFVIAVTNFDAVFLTLAAAKEVGAAEVSKLQKIILLAVNVFFFTLPMTLPLIFYLILPKFAGRVLGKANVYALKYSKYIVFILFAIFGIYFMIRGLKFFL